MAEFIHSILRPLAAVAADGVVAIDLPVNPLSAILIHVAPLNETSTITNFGLIRRLLSALDNIEVLFRGSQVFSLNGDDTYALNYLYHGIDIAQSNPVNTDNDRRSLVLPVLMGRRCYDPDECFPATKKGEFQLQVTADIADTGFDGLQLSVETIELLGANPKSVERVSTFSSTPAATGNNDYDMPIGWPIRAILGFGTTGFAGATPAPTLGALSVFKDNRQVYYTGTDFEVSRQIPALAGIRRSSWDEHLHSVNVAASTETDSRRQDDVFPLMELYTCLHFSMHGSDDYALTTRGAGRVHVRINAETANALRIMPVERVEADFYRSQSGA